MGVSGRRGAGLCCLICDGGGVSAASCATVGGVSAASYAAVGGVCAA